MPEKYLRRDGLPLLLRHTGATTLPEQPPTAGSGPTVVFLHDAGLQSSVFSDVLSSLDNTAANAANAANAAASNINAASNPARSAAVSFDLPGHGRSGGLDALASIEEMAETARWVASWCQFDRPILVGHGMGALVALEWARADGDSVAALVLCGLGRSLAIDDEAIETMRRVTRGKAPRPFDPSRIQKDSGPDLMKRAYMEGIATDPRTTLGDLEASRRWCDAFDEKAASALACSTLFVDGAGESAEALDRSKHFAQSFSDSSQHLIEGASHYLPFEQSQALADEIGRMAETVATA